MATKTVRMTFTCGALLRRHVVRELRRSAIEYEVQLELHEDKGWLDSFFDGSVSGQEENVDAWVAAAKDYSARLEKT